MRKIPQNQRQLKDTNGMTKENVCASSDLHWQGVRQARILVNGKRGIDIVS